MELRKDYLLDRWTYISPGRGSRPKEYDEQSYFPSVQKCHFCPGNEDETLSIGEIKKKGKWDIRWIKNKFPAVSLEKGKTKISGFFSQKPSFGRQEVIIETNEHNLNFSDFSKEHMINVINIYKERINELYKIPGIKYVCLFKNFGPDSGASIVHAHTQIFAMGSIPEYLKEEITASKKFKTCPFCSIVKKERNSKRFAHENQSFIAICPYAPRFSFEVWILAKKHRKSLNDFSPLEISDLADMLKYITGKIDSSYNVYFHYSPDKRDDFHMHIEITPRNSIWAGFELASGRYIVSASPEEAALLYRKKK